MAKQTPQFNDMVAARGGRGQTSAAPAPRSAAPPKAPAKGGKVGGKMPKPPMARDTDADGM